MTSTRYCDDREESLQWICVKVEMRVGNDGERCGFLSKTCFFRDAAVSENRENRTICKPGMFIFIFLINNDKEGISYEK